ncbi:TIGR02269 family lipoprotein [Myxococcaceae bacterium GXIMD 01537]
MGRTLRGVWLGLLLAACASTGGERREEESSWNGDADSLVFLCGEEACAFYRHGDVAPGRVVLARGSMPVAPPPLAAPVPGAMRYWGSAQGLPRDARPVFIIPWYNEKPQPLLPQWSEEQRRELERAREQPRVKHHIFPREELLRLWFKAKGINVHQWTLVLLKDDHDRIHRGPRGGPWNEAWRRYMIAKRGATKEEIWRYAGELIQRFELYGPVISYWRRLPPPPPSRP